MSEQRTKQRKISAADLETLAGVPDEAKATAFWLWLHMDPLGRGVADPRVIARRMNTGEPLDLVADRVEEHLLMLMDAGWLTTFDHLGDEWILLLYPLKVDMRDVRITSPEPPPGTLPAGYPVAVGGAGARARERAREQVRAEGAARADAWDAVQRDRERAPERPERPAVLDAPPMFCDEHMPGGAGKTKCGPCRDARNKRDAWLAEKVYEQKLTTFYEAQPETGEVWGGDPF
ncbi:hypothetical protein ACTJI8_12925 [Microbacterium sp. 22303]|uniref:hypothetical protein n=1 Tax=Microbacterium sp. 22303 TaxID=3453905 RepID=UPI003F850804